MLAYLTFCVLLALSCVSIFSILSMLAMSYVSIGQCKHMQLFGVILALTAFSTTHIALVAFKYIDFRYKVQMNRDKFEIVI